MSFWEILLIGIGLAMDAFAVSLCKGLAMEELNKKYVLALAGFFGGFQALMPLLGWLLGTSFRQRIETYDHWIAFALLVIIGGKMIKDALKEMREDAAENEEEEGSEETVPGQNTAAPSIEELKRPNKKPYTFKLGETILLAIATSIDALAVGLSFAMLGTESSVSTASCLSIWYSILIIGLVTFLICAAGVVLGHRFGSRFRSKAEIIGGIVLILIGIKILIEHLA